MSIGVCLTLLAGTVAADDYVGGLPLTTVQTGTVTGDLYVSGNPPSGSDFVKVVDRTFTLPAAAVAESGRVKWARLYVSSYCGHMQNAYNITYTTKADWNNDGTWDNTWTEPNANLKKPFIWMQGGDYGGGGNDNSAFPGHGTGEPYLMLNDHTTRVTSDYLSWYDVTNLIQTGDSTIKVNVDATGSYDGRIKVVELVVAYDDPSSTTQTTYWVNEGHDSLSYYTELYEDFVATGSTTFNTSGLSGITSATLIADYMASSNACYGFPTDDNVFDVDDETGLPTGHFTNVELDNVPDAQGQYSGKDSWNVTSLVANNNSVKLAYARNLTATGLSRFYKIPLAFLVVKKPAGPGQNLTITKTANPTTYTTVGQQITYTYTVKNSGNALISGIKITDNKTKVTISGTTLAPGASVTGTGTYTIKQDDITAGSVTNSAFATGKNGKITVTSNTVTATVTAIQSPAINLTKIAKPTTYKKVGQVIKYTYTVTNLGNVPISDIAVADNKTTVTIKNGTLAPGKSVKGTGAYTITQDDITAGSVTNTATATGTFNGSTVTTNTETVTVTAEQTKALKIKKTADTKTYNTTGQTINYTYTVTNSGNVPISGIVVNDNKATVVIDNEIAPGSSVTGIGTYTITLDDMISGSVTNTATATGTFNGDTVTSNTVTVTIKAKQSPALTITKTADPTTFSTEGQTIAYTYTVTNSGNVPVSNIEVDDDKVSVVTISSDTLAPGSSVTGTGTYTITSADLKKGSVTNKATATGTFNGKTVKSKVKATATVTKIT